MAKIVLFNKPYNVLSQFTDKGTEGTPRETLSNFIDVPNVYPAGRLDRDSEGLMVLTDDGLLQARISNPKFKLEKIYFAQVEGVAAPHHLEDLQKGVQLKDGRTRPAKAALIDPPDFLWPRHPPIRERKSVPDSWLSLTITEGRNRQVRRMTAAVGLPTLRLIRTQVGEWTLDGLKVGEFKVIEVPNQAPRPQQRKKPRNPNFQRKK